MIPEFIAALNAAIAHYNRGQLAEALAALDEIDMPIPHSEGYRVRALESNFLRAVVLASAGKPLMAIEHFKLAYELDPRREDLCSRLGRLLVDMGRVDEGGYYLKKGWEQKHYQGREEVLVIGDSHAEFCFAAIPRCRVKWLGPYTMHRVGRDGLAALDFQACGVAGLSRVVLAFGEIDVRVHVHKQAAVTEGGHEAVIENLCDTFLATVGQNMAAHPGVKVAIAAVLPPFNGVVNPDLPRVGTLRERALYTKLINQRLRERGAESGCGFIDLHAHFADAAGGMNPLYSDGSNHSRRTYSDLIEYEMNQAFGA